MRILNEYELSLVAGGTASSDDYTGSSGLWYESGGGSGGGGGGGSTGIWYWVGTNVAIYVGNDLSAAGPSGYWAFYSMADPNTGTFGGGSGSGGSSEPSNTDYTVTHDDAPCENGAALAAGTQIAGLVNSVGSYEFVGLLGRNSDGSYGLVNNEVSTTFSRTSATFDVLDSYAGVYGIVHNHEPNPTDYLDNFQQRYPSTDDWMALDVLVAGGADPTHLSVFIIDPFGTMREFQYSDRAMYEGMDRQQRANGDNLPPATTGCQPTGG